MGGRALLSATLLLTCASAQAASEVRRTVVRIPPETVRTAVSYDETARRLTLRCVRASLGVCRFRIAGVGPVRTVALGSGKTQVYTNVPTTARTCAGGRNMPAAHCAWSPVHVAVEQ